MQIKKMKLLKNTVKEVLEDHPQTRSNDFLLIRYVLGRVKPETLIMTFSRVMLYAKEMELPSFASITRARRVVFKQYPELCPEETKIIRKKEQEEYKKWIKSEE